MAPGRLRLGQTRAGVFFGVQQLALQVAFFYVIPIDEPERAHSRAGQQRRLCRAQLAASHDDGCCIRKAFLALWSQRGEADLAAVAIWLQRWRTFWRHRSRTLQRSLAEDRAERSGTAGGSPA